MKMAWTDSFHYNLSTLDCTYYPLIMTPIRIQSSQERISSSQSLLSKLGLYNLDPIYRLPALYPLKPSASGWKEGECLYQNVVPRISSGVSEASAAAGSALRGFIKQSASVFLSSASPSFSMMA